MSDSTHDLLDVVLARAVALTTGNDDAAPRPGQVALAHDVLDAMLGSGQSASSAPTGVGKALDIETPVATPHGWITMGEIKVGDVVFDETGAETTVTWISNVMTDRACYEVVFSDGSKIVADADHQWATATRELRLKQAGRRRMESGIRDDSIGRLQHINRLKILRRTIDHGDYVMTRRDVIERFPEYQNSLLRARRKSDSRELNIRERFDIRPAMDDVIASFEKICGLMRNEPDDFEVMTTAQMRSTLKVKDALNHAVRVAGPIDTKIAELPIDPYLFGVWLGDGSSGSGCVTSGAQDVDELVRNVKSTGYHIDIATRENDSRTLSFRQPRPDLCPYGHDDFVSNIGKRVNRTCLECLRTRPSKDNRTRVNRWNEPLSLHLRRLGVLGDKHIPNIYLRASIEQRLLLLQGLMDTDGTANGRKCAIDLCNERLANDVYELVTSLGIRSNLRIAPATITETVDGVRHMRVVGSRWRMSFTTNEPLFRFERKLAMQMKGNPSSGQMTTFRYVKEIRPVATRPVRCIQVSSPNHLFLAGRAMIPTHNSMAYSVPAALLAAKSQKRTVIATESLNLQGQLVEKDLPIVVEAIEQVVGIRPTFALLKGWANYVCAAATAHRAGELTGDFLEPTSNDQLATLESLKTSLETSPLLVDANDAASVVAAINAHLFGATGDRAAIDTVFTDEQWNNVSVSLDECPGASKCPFGEVCRPAIAREVAGKSDIVVTNHALLAIQAATAAPVVINNKNIGEVDHLVIDEAHGLANSVRSQGATSVSAMRLFEVLRSLERLHSSHPGRTKSLRASGIEVMKALDKSLASKLRGASGPVTIKPGDDALDDDVRDEVLAWLKASKTIVPNPSTSTVMGEIRARRRAGSRIDSLTEAVDNMATDATGVARWIEQEWRPNRPTAGLESITGATLQLSPVDVAPLLKGNLYTAGSSDEDPDATKMLVSVLSATLPQPVVVELGITARRKEYESPFREAFSKSALFVPKVREDELGAIAARVNGRWKFETAKHLEWASDHIVRLVTENGGSALVLSATTSAGKRYAEALRSACHGFTTYSQWDGGPSRAIVSAWRDDESSVLVGTRSLMTGVDAPSMTCSLVILDRVPRSPSNPVDDARAAKIQERLDIDRWAADRLVFCADAALLLEQAAGRLIRSVSDSGMVAVLDPRLLKSSPMKYPEPTRLVYMAPLERFEHKMVDLAAATKWLREHRATVSATSGT